MKANLAYIFFGLYFALVQALVIGVLVSFVNKELGLITSGVILGWLFTELIYNRKGKW